MKELIKKYLDEVIELNNDLSDYPEIGSEEFESSKKIVELLRKYGIEVEYPFLEMPTAFRGIINKGEKHKAAILVEYDALRGIGHACGHCASAAISVLSALVLNEIRDEIPAEIHIIGTPDEEMRGGKVPMVNAGIFDDMDFAIMMHMSNSNVVYSGSLALNAYKIEFHGKPAHAASIPWEGRNALNAARLFLDSVDMMRQHVKDDVRLHGYIENGGDASNTVPHYVSIEMLVRAKDREYLDEVSAWVRDCVAGAALATRTSFTISEIGEKYDGLRRNKAGEEVLVELYKELKLPLIDMSDKTGGSSDIGNVSQRTAAFHPYISIGEELHAHTEEFAKAMKTQKNYKAIENGGELLAKFVRDVYKSEDILEKIRFEFNKKEWRQKIIEAMIIYIIWTSLLFLY